LNFGLFLYIGHENPNFFCSLLRRSQKHCICPARAHKGYSLLRTQDFRFYPDECLHIRAKTQPCSKSFLLELWLETSGGASCSREWRLRLKLRPEVREKVFAAFFTGKVRPTRFRLGGEEVVRISNTPLPHSPLRRKFRM